MDRAYLDTKRTSYYFNMDDKCTLTTTIDIHVTASFLKVTLPIGNYSKLILTEINVGERNVAYTSNRKTIVSWNIGGMRLLEIDVTFQQLTEKYVPDMMIIYNPSMPFEFLSRVFKAEGYDEEISISSNGPSSGFWIVWQSNKIEVVPQNLHDPIFTFMII